MSAKTDAAVKEKPPAYEISPTRIFIILALNLVIRIAATVLTCKYKTKLFVYFYFLILFVLLLRFYWEYYISPKYVDIPSRIYHPDLLSQKEFESLNERYKKVEKKKRNYLGKPLSKEDQQEYDNLKSTIDLQNDLRTLCLFKKLIGVQQCSAKETVNENLQKVSTKSSAINDKIPTYEISPKWILIYLTVNFVLAVSAILLFVIFRYIFPYTAYIVIYFFAVLMLFSIYYDRPNNISSVIYHPDLMSDTEFKDLKSQFEEVEKMKHNYRKAGQPLPAKYQQEYDNLKPIIDAQKELRALCWFKSLIGVPKFVIQENTDENSIAAKETVRKEATLEDSNAKAMDKTDSPAKSTCDSEFNSSSYDSNVPDVSTVTALQAKIEKLETHLENHEAQLAEIKADNAKLKNFVETFIESHAIF